MAAHPVAVLRSHGLAAAELGLPRQNEATQVDLLDQGPFGRKDLGRDHAGRLEDRGVVAPGAGDHVIPMPHRVGSWTDCLRGLARPDDDLRSLARQSFPAVVELDVEADLDTEPSKVAREDGKLLARSHTVLEHLAGLGGDRVNLPVDARDLSLSIQEGRGVGAEALLPVFEHEERHDDVASVLAGLRRQLLQYWPLEG